MTMVQLLFCLCRQTITFFWQYNTLSMVSIRSSIFKVLNIKYLSKDLFWYIKVEIKLNMHKSFRFEIIFYKENILVCQLEDPLIWAASEIQRPKVNLSLLSHLLSLLSSKVANLVNQRLQVTVCTSVLY